MQQHLFMGVDLGGTVIKVGIFKKYGQEVAIIEQHQPLLTPIIGFSERDLEQLWQTTCLVIKATIESAQIDPSLIKGISFSSHGKGIYLLDQNRENLYNGILSSDNRAQSIVNKLNNNGIAQKAYQRSLQQLWPSHPAALLIWLKQNNPIIYKKIGYVLMAHDYIRYRLTGNIHCEETNISGSNLYNQYQSCYDIELLKLFDLEDIDSKLAPIISSTQLAGNVTLEAALLTGLKKDTKVYAGLFDVVGATLVSGINNSYSLSATAGTWTISTRIFDKIIPSDYHYVWGKYCVDGQYFVHEGSPTSASNLAWFINQFFPDDNNIYHKLEQWIEECYQQQDSQRPIFFPWLFGSNFDSNLSANFIGIQGHHTKKDIIYAIYEGIVFSHLLHQDRILDLAPQTDKIRFTGGPTRSIIWMQMFCDATNLPVEIIDIKQAGCLAAALCAAVGSGEYDNFDQAIAQYQVPVLRLEPNYEKYKLLKRRFVQFKKIAQSLASLENKK